MVAALPARLAAFALSPELLASVAGFDELDAFQLRIMVTASTRLAIVAARQAGKSTAVGLACTRRAFRQRESKTIIGAPSKDQALLLLNTVRDMLIKLECPFSRETEDRIVLEHNGSSILAIAGTPKFARGHAGIDLLVVDEASFVGDDFFQAILPVVTVSHGSIFLLSSAGAAIGYFYEAASDTTGMWETIKVTADQVSRISPETLKFFKETMPSWSFAAEFYGVFSASDNAVFNPDDIDKAMHPELMPLFPGRLFGQTVRR
jgi:hypothetical protein